MNHVKPIMAGVLLLFAVLACNYPRGQSPTPFVFPTPNLSLTAIARATLNPTGAATGTHELPIPDTGTAIFPTATQNPDATLTPTQTVPTLRPGVSANATYLNTTPAVDGDFSEWSLDSYQVTSVVYGAGNWVGSSDLSGSVMIGWNEDNLYLAARVVDDHYVQEASGLILYQGDSLEIQLDADLPDDFEVRSLNSDDYQIGISPGTGAAGENPEAFLWNPIELRGSRSQVLTGARQTDEGYDIEVAIPWSVLNTTPEAGKTYGFTFSISDNDADGERVQETMISLVPTRRLTDPTSWGNLTLVRQ